MVDTVVNYTFLMTVVGRVASDEREICYQTPETTDSERKPVRHEEGINRNKQWRLRPGGGDDVDSVTSHSPSR